MKSINIKNSAVALGLMGLLGLLGCGGPTATDAPKSVATDPDAPVVSGPKVQYDIYDPTTEEDLKRDTNYGYLIAKTRPNFKEAAFESLGLAITGKVPAGGAIFYQLYKSSDVLAALKSLKLNTGVLYAEADLKVDLHADVPTNPIAFNNIDPNLGNRTQWGAYVTKAFDAWTTLGFGQHRPVVANVDSGVKYRHVDLRNQVRHAFSWWVANTADSVLDPMGSVNNWEPYDYKALQPNGTGTDSNGHGTHTSGIICAEGNNGAGATGMCWNVDLVQYRGFNVNSASSSWSVYGSLWHLARWKKANNITNTIPVNFSLGSPANQYFIIDMMENALQNDIMMVASSGNDWCRVSNYPAAIQGVMCVGASDQRDKRAFFSNYGPHLSVLAPGQDIISTVTTDYGSSNFTQYMYLSGTSMAAPQVTGLIGYMLTFNPNLKPDQIKTYIEKNADKVDGRTAWDEEYGHGRINVLRTIQAVIDDLKADRTPATDYVRQTIKIKTPANGVTIYLYECDSAGAVKNYVASGITGFSFVGLMGDEDAENNTEPGCTYFNLLKPGTYIAVGGLGKGDIGKTDVFTVKAGETAQKTLELKISGKPLIIQVGPNQNAADTNGQEWTDTVIDFYDSLDGEPVRADLDYDVMDQFTMLMPTEPGDYYIRVTNYQGGAGGPNTYLPANGEYCLYVTNGRVLTGQNINLIRGDTGGIYRSQYFPGGSFNNPGEDVKSAQAQSRATAQPLTFDKRHQGRFGNNGGTNGAIGHYYKFTVTEGED